MTAPAAATDKARNACCKAKDCSKLQPCAAAPRRDHQDANGRWAQRQVCAASPVIAPVPKRSADLRAAAEAGVEVLTLYAFLVGKLATLR